MVCNYFLTTLNCAVFPFSSVTLKIYIPASNEEIETSDFPPTKLREFIITDLPDTSVTFNEATPSPSI